MTKNYSEIEKIHFLFEQLSEKSFAKKIIMACYCNRFFNMSTTEQQKLIKKNIQKINEALPKQINSDYQTKIKSTLDNLSADDSQIRFFSPLEFFFLFNPLFRFFFKN